MKTAPIRDDALRARQIAYIKARCKNQLGDAELYRAYIQRRFCKASLADLTDDELARTKAYIARRPPERR
ncbi:MAG: hypothetical protein Fur0034_20130 [Desulfuromonadia bacterium]